MGLARGVRRYRHVLLAVAGLAVVAPLAGGCGSKPVATVNGESLSEKDFAKLCETATSIQPNGGSVGLQVLAMWVRNTMLAQEAKRLKVYPTEKELETRLLAYRKDAEFRGRNLDEELAQRGLAPDVFKRDLLNVLVGENVMFRNISVSDDEIKKMFEMQKERFVQPERVKFSQITLESEAKMKEARDDLGANTDFGLVASSRSRDQFAQNRGVVPVPLPRTGLPAGSPVSQQAIDAAFKLNPGEVSDPIKVAGTWVIVKLDEKIPEKRPNLEEIKEIVRSTIRQQKAQGSPQTREVEQSLMEMTQKAQVTINRPEYKTIEAQLKAPAGPAGPGGEMPMAPGG
jgi:parvulin-like peptidyl-prolyl isomerase